MNEYQLNGLIGVAIAVLFCVCFNFVAVHLWHYIPRKDYTYAKFTFEEEVKANYSAKEIDQIDAVNIILGFFCTPIIIDFKEFNDNSIGKTYRLAHKVVINTNIDGWETLESLTHEFLHIIFDIDDEYYIQYLTFRVLYESDVPILVLKAKEIAYKLCTLGTMKGTSYDCSWYIKDYLKDFVIE